MCRKYSDLPVTPVCVLELPEELQRDSSWLPEGHPCKARSSEVSEVEEPWGNPFWKDKGEAGNSVSQMLFRPESVQSGARDGLPPISGSWGRMSHSGAFRVAPGKRALIPLFDAFGRRET